MCTFLSCSTILVPILYIVHFSKKKNTTEKRKRQEIKLKRILLFSKPTTDKCLFSCNVLNTIGEWVVPNTGHLYYRHRQPYNPTYT